MQRRWAPDPGNMRETMKRYTSIRLLQRDLARCRHCAEAGYVVESAPVIQGAAGRRAYLYGQAPGIVEGAESAPWRGRAGRSLRRWLELDEATFDATFYCASVTRCYPGRTSGRGDRTPTPAERRLCAPWHAEELRLLRPTLVITVGALAAREVIDAPSLAECVGKSYVVDDAIVIPLPHPSGASAWLHDPVNRARLGKALTHARREIARLDEPANRPRRASAGQEPPGPEAVCEDAGMRTTRRPDSTTA